MFKELTIQRGLRDIRPLLEIEFIKNGDAFICGGYARYCLSPNYNTPKAGDVDIYCKDENIFNDLVSYFSLEGFEIRFDNPIALTYLKNYNKKWKDCPVIQLIKPIREGAIVANGTVEDILDNFDFTIVRCALKYKKEDYKIAKWMGIADKDFENDEMEKQLKIKKIHCPVSSLLRFMKYGKKGYNARPMQILSLFYDWDNRTQEYRSNLIEKLETITKGDTLTEEEINQLEALLRID